MADYRLTLPVLARDYSYREIEAMAHCSRRVIAKARKVAQSRNLSTKVEVEALSTDDLDQFFTDGCNRGDTVTLLCISSFEHLHHCTQDLLCYALASTLPTALSMESCFSNNGSCSSRRMERGVTYACEAPCRTVCADASPAFRKRRPGRLKRAVEVFEEIVEASEIALEPMSFFLPASDMAREQR